MKCKKCRKEMIKMGLASLGESKSLLVKHECVCGYLSFAHPKEEDSKSPIVDSGVPDDAEINIKITNMPADLVKNIEMSDRIEANGITK